METFLFQQGLKKESIAHFSAFVDVKVGLAKILRPFSLCTSFQLSRLKINFGTEKFPFLVSFVS